MVNLHIKYCVIVMNQLNVFLLWISLWISVRILTTIFFINLFKYLINCFTFFFTTLNYFFIYPPPLPSPTLYGYLDSGTSDIHRGGHATASYASLSMGIQPQRNTLCLYFLTKPS